MAQSIYITSAEGHSGKSTIALGVLDTLSRKSPRVGVFRAIARSTEERDYVLEMLLDHDGVDLGYDECIGVTYDEVRADPEAALGRIVERYKAVEAQCDAVVIVGSDYTDVGSPAELGYNARIAANLGAPVLVVLAGQHADGERDSAALSPEQVGHLATLALGEITHERAGIFAVVVNRADPARLDETVAAVRAVPAASGDIGVWAIPEDAYLVAPSVGDVARSLGATLVKGDEALLEREVLHVVVAGMSLNNVLPRLEDAAILAVAADRTEVLLAALLANASGTFPSLSGIVLYGPFELPDPVERLIDGLDSNLPILATDQGTYETVRGIMSARGRLAAHSQRRYDTALALFDQHVDTDDLLRRIGLASSDVVTPLMFQYRLIERARRDRRRIVLPEGGDDRILRAAATALARGIADITILGEPIEVRSRALELGLDIQAAEVLSPFDAVHVDKFAREYERLRAHKGVTFRQAADTVTDVSYFGTLMVHLGLADGMVSGAAHTTAHTIRPAFEIIKTKPGVDVVSSVFLMALADRVLVYGDCAVIPDPTAPQLADIAVSSAATAAQFGIDPRIAMLSYSTGESGSGADVEKVREATALVRERASDLLVEGPIQYDAATDAAVAATKMPGSDVAGRATVFVFPDLNTGNNTYKAVQRSAGAVAMGPVLQGLNKPINDLSRGALVEDIVNTIAITAIQAQNAGAEEASA
ncbi:phosphate acetyltransferase [Microbacterium sp. EYE_5]|uniref:phosphate acetyltransferase n=1 Tax=unclassified Microbacterium TaxID=2609290 RepID=UPI00200644D9|nr:MULTISPECIES: phosphate acetyltransferase [unclassified Microbacterium]MCK6080319.1 phosphate acetyltransferase [Microbacterium sp. EYE_382]MCK6085590.1 phosphate acetyltransferase [Microbacterium sp. EYE_384]MCK6122185.1 phosphate acetyltransferase [Microbacterium sp. EYE_80]MCK6126353.1 phosphate acetyltransferase [Microbacterium sp. EYE_79]MCK6141274.1 phosphate acetyltransferase [Microbacterium sp. EYE_39]